MCELLYLLEVALEDVLGRHVLFSSPKQQLLVFYLVRLRGCLLFPDLRAFKLQHLSYRNAHQLTSAHLLAVQPVA